MDDFPTSPPKRRRTSSPLEPAPITLELNQSNQPLKHVQSQEMAMDTPSAPKSPVTDTNNDVIPGLSLARGHSPADVVALEKTTGEESGILDALMQHVESEWQDPVSSDSAQVQINIPESEASNNLGSGQIVAGNVLTTSNPEGMKEDNADMVPPNPPYTQASAILSEHTQAFLGVASLPRPAETHPSVKEAEWELDSSPQESSSDTDSSSDMSTSDESDDEDADGDYPMLDPQEQARILMQGDGGSDEEGGHSKDKGSAAQLRTANEREEQVIPKPQIQVTADMPIEELGKVEGVVEATVLLKAKVSGEYQVLESGSLLCTKDREVVGVVAETLGRVEQPMYTIRFTNDKAVEEVGLGTAGVPVYYVPQHSTFVFTQPLKSAKWTDASNFHDEEVGEEEMEFSDDEAEAEHKRRLKMKRKGITEDPGPRGRGRGRGSRSRGDRQYVSCDSHRRSQDVDAAYGNGSLEMNYDEGGGDDEGYTPLARPSNYQEMVGHASVPMPRQQNSSYSTRARGHGHRGHGGDRGGRAGRGRGRAGWDSTGGSDRPQSYPVGISTHSPPQPFDRSVFNIYPQQTSQSIPSQMLPPQHPYQYHQQTPQAPSLSPLPSNSAFPFSPSPISPLPGGPFSFGSFGQQPNQYPYQQQMPSLVPQSNPTYLTGQPQWQGNQIAAAEVQRQLEAMRNANKHS